MIIIHGDDLVNSRAHLNELIAKTGETRTISRFAADRLDPTTLTQLLQSRTLFGQEPLLVIEGGLTLAKSKNKDLLLDLLRTTTPADVILYEDRQLSATALKTFPKAKVYEYKPAALIFKFLESLRPNNASVCLQILSQLEDSRQPAELIFFMLVRQVRLLIQALHPAEMKGAPWQVQRLSSQARLFGEIGLLQLHDQLYHLDQQLKTGQNNLDLSLQLFNLIAAL